MTVNLSLQAHDVDPERGYLPQLDPLERLPTMCAAWEELGRALPKILMGVNVRREIGRMPPIDAGLLADDRQRRRAMVLLSFIGHAYVWGEEGIVASIPATLAQPWREVATALGRPPVLSYASYALDNWRRLDPARPVELGNIALLQNFLGGQDEEWFVLIHVAIEARVGPALGAIVAAQRAVASNEPDDVTRHLQVIAQTIDELHDILLRMPERCDPYIYFHRVRPYLHGWAGHPGLTEGLVYEGVAAYAGEPQRFRGETGAQSSIVPALDAALGIEHAEDPLRSYLREMLDYMPPSHRAFVAAIEQGPSIREHVLDKRAHAPLREAYNAAVDGLERFRSTHFEYVQRYIMQQSAGGDRNPNSVGTGGTPFGPYLRKHRDETRKHTIRAEP